MADEKKGRTRRGRTEKAVVPPRKKQLSIKDMFGGSESNGESQTTVVEPVSEVAELGDASDLGSAGPSSKDIVTVDLTLEGDTSDAYEPVPKRPLHPFFIKRTEAPAQPAVLPPDCPTSEDDSFDEIVSIVVKGRPGAPSKPLYSIFSKAATTSHDSPLSSPGAITTTDAEDDAPEGSSWEVPIVIESSPARSRPPKYNKPVRKSNEGGKFLKRVDAPLPPLPDKDSQHVSGSRTDYPGPQAPFPPRIPDLSIPLDRSSQVHANGDISWLKSRDTSPTPSTSYLSPASSKLDNQDSSTYIDTIPSTHQSHPSIQRLLEYAEVRQSSPSTSSTTQELWVDRWKPQRSEELLGNEEHAEYLKHWMVELKLHHQQQPQPSTVASTEQPRGSKKRKPAKTKTKSGSKSKAKSKKPNIVRHVNKRRKLMDELEEDFLAMSDLTDTEDANDVLTASSDFDDFAFCEDTYERLSGLSLPQTDESCPPTPPFFASQVSIESEHYAAYLPPLRARKPPRFGTSICSTMLLTGPSGCGKTAAVYACARELGWDVFEIYPGIGERNGTDLKRLLGDIGKNHLVKLQASPKKKKPETDFFSSQTERTRRRAKRRVTSQDDLTAVAEVDSNVDVVTVTPPRLTAPLPEEGSLHGDEDAVEPTVNQVVVLIEEVDVLYQTDLSFWPALINIIKECKRPVILTCNDISRVPCQDLALQNILDFAPCPTPLAVSYLQALCLAEGLTVTREDLTQLYDGSELEDGPPRQDLRHAIMELQYSLVNGHLEMQDPQPSGGAVQDDKTRSSPEATLPSVCDDAAVSSAEAQGKRDASILFQLSRAMDLGSFVDSHLSREVHAHLRAVFADELSPSTDDLQGYRVLHEQLDTDNCPVSALFKADEDVRAHALTLAQHIVPAECSAAIPTPALLQSLDMARLQYQRQVGPILRQPISERGPSPWRMSASEEALYLDYAPWIRYIVAADDALELATRSLPGSQRRSTRNSMRTAQDRWLRMDADERRTLSQTSLRLDEESSPSPLSDSPV